MYLGISSIGKWLITLIFIITVILYFYIQNIWIKIEHFDIKFKNTSLNLHELKIAHISDVHIPNNYYNIDKMLNKLKKEKPDIIVATGDLIYKLKEIDEMQLGKLSLGLSKIAKTYAVTGNHEIWNNDVKHWYEILESNNVTVLDNKVEIFEKDQSFVNIMGLKEGCLYSEEYFNYKDFNCNFPKILLSHRPEKFNNYYSSSKNIRPDLVLSGHAHGGQFRIPFLNIAIYSPNQGIFPKYSSGLYVSENGVQMVVSRGLGNSGFPFRINNRIHIPIIHLK